MTFRLPPYPYDRLAGLAKLAEAHDEVLRLAEEQLEVGKRMVETGDRKSVV